MLDVRKNPISRKKGFSKKSLHQNLTRLGVEYIHIRSLGIDSSLRQNLKTASDYKRLFSFYRKDILPFREKELGSILSQLKNNKKVALNLF